MLSEILVFGKYFVKLHRRWIITFIRDEIILLTLELIGIFLVRTSLFQELSHIYLTWIFVVPACLAQLMLATHLGITYNLKTPLAWEMRLPFSRYLPCVWAYLLIGFNALLLLFVLFPIWSLFYEMTGYPIALLLFLTPCVTFQSARRTRTPQLGTISSIAVSLLFILITIIPILFTPMGQVASVYRLGSLSSNPTLEINIFFLAFSLTVAFLLDQSRRKYIQILIGVFLLTSLFFGVEKLSKYQIQHSLYFNKENTDYSKRLDKLNNIIHSQTAQCQKFRTEYDFFVKSSRHDGTNKPRFDSKTQILKGLEIIQLHPGAPYSRNEMMQLWEQLPHQPEVQRIFNSLVQIQSCFRMDLYNSLMHMIPRISNINGLRPQERQLLLNQVWKTTSQMIEEAVTPFDATQSIWPLLYLVEYHLVDGISIDFLNSLLASLKEINEKSVSYTKTFPELPAPTNRRWRHIIKNTYINKIEATDAIVNQLIEVKKLAKLKVF